MTSRIQTSSGSSTITATVQENEAKTKVLRLKLKVNNDNGSKVKWSEDTVDNEHMGKKSSKRKCSNNFVSGQLS